MTPQTRRLAALALAAFALRTCGRVAALERRVDQLATQARAQRQQILADERVIAHARRQYLAPRRWSELSRAEVVELGKALYDGIEAQRTDRPH